MYEDQTYEAILDRLLENTRDDIDKTEGSVLYTAIAPAGLEFAIHYTELDGLIREGYADTCDRDNRYSGVKSVVSLLIRLQRRF